MGSGQSSWIQAGEARYRRVVGHIPVVLYSVSLPHAMMARLPGSGAGAKRGAEAERADGNVGSIISAEAVVTLVSPACKQIFGAEPRALEGPFTRWTDLVHPDDLARFGEVGALVRALTRRRAPAQNGDNLSRGRMDLTMDTGTSGTKRRVK